MYEYGPELGFSWPGRRDETGEHGFDASVAVDDPLTGRHCQASEHRIHPIIEPPRGELVNVDARFLTNKKSHRQLKRDAYQAYVALKAAAERDGIPANLLTVVSAHRSVAHQKELWEQALRKYGTPERARIWVAPPGTSAHHTGRAIDFWLGSGLSSKNLGAMRATPAYRWLVCNAARFGFSPYAAEPWHWEFTPVGSISPSPAGPPSPLPGRTRRYAAQNQAWVRHPGANEGAPVGFSFFGEPAPPPPVALPGFSAAEQKALRITSTFETGRPLSFSGVTGNFDGQGLSLGLLQWNFGKGSLQPLIRRFIARFPARFNAIFGADAARLQALLDPHRHHDLMNFASLINDAHNHIVEPWLTRFTQLAEDPDFRQIQLDAVRPVMDAAEHIAAILCLGTERGLALSFDIATQQGSSWLNVEIGRTATHRGRTRDAMLRSRLIQRQTQLGHALTNGERLAVIANLVADTVLQRFREDVRRRKMTIVRGTGTVHGTQFDLGRQFGLTDQAWTAGAAGAGAAGGANPVPPPPVQPHGQGHGAAAH